MLVFLRISNIQYKMRYDYTVFWEVTFVHNKKTQYFKAFTMGVSKHSKTIVLIEHRKIKSILKVIISMVFRYKWGFTCNLNFIVNQNHFEKTVSLLILRRFLNVMIEGFVIPSFIHRLSCQLSAICRSSFIHKIRIAKTSMKMDIIIFLIWVLFIKYIPPIICKVTQ